ECCNPACGRHYSCGK
uniref:Alpha-conotoxin GIA n=1 Tax=Conus geographus TaxID=6491 RepID=CAIA_CONGE|nr:RecName: Full=Alpha-conotoxin GIA [Conus geographus]